jgi:SAM-dependent methyltransferase
VIDIRIERDFIGRDCPLCGSAEFKVFADSNIRAQELTESAFASRKLPEYMHPRMVRCLGCELLYANPVLNPSVLGAAYKEAAFDSQQESKLASVTYRALLEARINRLKRGNALDIGAGDGAFLEQLVDLGFHDVIGVEPSDASIAAASPSTRKLIRRGIFRADEFQREAFGLVTCFQVMEHVPDPLPMTREAFSLLRSGGMFFAVVHNSRALSARLLGTKSPIFDVEHLQLFHPKTAIELLQRAGFAEVSACSIWNRYPAEYWIKLFPFPGALKRALMRLAGSSKLGQIRLSIPAGNLAVFGFKPAL